MYKSKIILCGIWLWLSTMKFLLLPVLVLPVRVKYYILHAWLYIPDDRDTFMCNGRCLGLGLQCDGIDDCGNNLDEQNCGMIFNVFHRKAFSCVSMAIRNICI